MKLPLIEQVEGQIILGFSIIEFFMANGIASHEILIELLLHVQHCVVGSGGRENKSKLSGSVILSLIGINEWLSKLC